MSFITNNKGDDEMALLDRDFVGTINLNDGKLTIDTIKMYNTDRSIFTLAVKLSKSSNKIIDYVKADEMSKYKVELLVVKPISKQVKIVDGTIINDTFCFDLDEEFNNMVGKYQGQFYVYFDKPNTTNNIDDDERITSTPFTYTVEASVTTGLNDGIAKDPDLPVLENLIREVKTLAGLSVGDPDSVFSNYYTKSEIDEMLNNGSNEVNSSELSEYQTRSDDGLNTSDKTIVGAINEVNSKSVSGGISADMIVDDLETADKTKVLSANQGWVIGQELDLRANKNDLDGLSEIDHGHIIGEILGLNDALNNCCILTSPNGTRYKIIVDDNGVLSTTVIE